MTAATARRDAACPAFQRPPFGRPAYTAAMLAAFLTELFDHGRVHVEPLRSTTWRRTAIDAIAVLRDADRRSRLHLPTGVPPVDFDLALMAATQFADGCRLLVDYRQNDLADEVAKRLASLRPGGATAAVSVDLTFRYLPDLIRLAITADADGPLARALSTMAETWPLSSVGAPGTTASLPAEVWSVPALRMLYCDRVISRRDIERAAHPLVAAELDRLLPADSPVRSALLPTASSPEVEVLA